MGEDMGQGVGAGMSLLGQLDFSWWTVAASFIFGTWGLYLLKKGKREANIPRVLIAVLLLAYSYFVTSPVPCWMCGIALVIVDRMLPQ